MTMKLGSLFLTFSLSGISLLSFGGVTPTIKIKDPSPIKFEENKGQLNSKVYYEADLIKSGKLFLEKNKFTFLFWDPYAIEKMHHPHDVPEEDARKNGILVKFHAYTQEFLGADPSVNIFSENAYSNYKNYFQGNDPSKWASDVKLFANVNYTSIYPNIDLAVYSQEKNFKYDIIVKPGGNTDLIKIKYDGIDGLHIKNGNLIIPTSIGDISEQKPYAYQILNGKKIKVTCNFILDGNNLSFEFPRGYDKANSLIIDPTLICSTFTGSTADNWGYTATYDAAGNIYSGGIVDNIGYPTSIGAYQTTFGGGGCGGNCYPFDIAIIKYNPTGTNMLYATYLGGSDNEQPHSIVVNSNNELLVFGRTYSSNFPTTVGAFDVSMNGGSDIIISKFNSTGTTLLASTYVGGSNDDAVNINADFYTWNSLKYNYGDDARGEIITDAANNCYVASCTKSNNFPVTPGSFQTTFQGGLQDGCVLKFNSTLTTLIWSTYLGGNNNDAAYALALDNNNNVYATGGTASSNFPSTVGVLHPGFQGGLADGFITRIASNGASVMQSTFIGTNQYDQSYFVQLDKNYDVYVFGQTEGVYPISTGVYSNPGSGQFIHKINPTLSATIYSTVFGSGTLHPNISPAAFLVDTCENVYTSGWGGQCIPFGSTGTTTGMHVTTNAFQSTTDGCDFYFFVLKKNAVTLWYATFFGGAGSDEHVDGGTSRFDKGGKMYQSVCAGCGGTSNFPTTVGAWSQTNNSFNCNNAVIKMDFQLVNLNAVAAAAPADTICVGQTINFTNNSIGAVNYVWNFGDGSQLDTNHTPSHVYNSTGNFTVILIAIDSNSCKFSDTTQFVVTVLPYPIVSLGNDTTLCGTPNIILNAGNPGLTYTWSTGATTQTITAIVAGTYWVKVDNGFCNKTDTINILLLTDPTLGNDTSICAGTSITLSASNPGANYTWSTGATTQTISVSTTGLYWVTASTGNCFQTDSINVTTIPLPVVSLGRDTIICPGNFLTLDALNPGLNYLWSTGATTQTIVVSNPGAYSVTVSNGPCSRSDTMVVLPQGVLDLGPDVDLCDLPHLTLDAGNPGASYFWSTNDTTRTIIVTDPSTYWVTITQGACVQHDTIQVTGGIGGSMNLYVPNSFTPNRNGLNDVFMAKGDEVLYFDMKIFDRWGQFIFESKDINQGWDGTYKGRKVQEDVYVWMIDYSNACTQGEILTKLGHVSVLH